MIRETKKPDAANVQPLLAAGSGAKPIRRQYKYMNNAANAAARFTPNAYACSGSTSRSKSGWDKRKTLHVGPERRAQQFARIPGRQAGVRTEESLTGVTYAVRMKLKVVEPEESAVAAQDKPRTIEGRNRDQHQADGEQVSEAPRVEQPLSWDRRRLVAGIHKSGPVEKEEVSLPCLMIYSLGVSQTIQIIRRHERLYAVLSVKRCV